MLANYVSALNGKKTYILAITGGIIAVMGHFWGPAHLGPVSLPQVSTDDMWKALWSVASLASIRHGISTSKGGN